MHLHFARVVFAALGLAATSAAQPPQPTLLLDIHTGGVDSSPRSFTTFGNVTAFVASRSTATSAYLTIGTPAGTARVFDVGTSARVISVADRLWIATSLVAVLDPAAATSILLGPANVISDQPFGDGLLVDVGSMLHRYDNDGTSSGPLAPVTSLATAHVFGEEAFVVEGPGIVRTDGTAAGTTTFPLLGFPATGASFDGRLFISSLTQFLTSAGGPPTLFAPSSGAALLVPSDERLFAFGAGTVFVTDGTPGTGTNLSVPQAIFLDDTVAFAGGVLFTDLGGGLSFIDGTGAVSLGATSVRDITVVSRDTAFFVVGGGGSPGTLWQTDGTAAGTFPIFPGFDVRSAAYADGRVFLGVDDSSAGIEPFVFRPEVVNAPIGHSCSGHPTGTHTLRTDVDPRLGQTVNVIGRSRFDGAGVGTTATLFFGSVGLPAPVTTISRCMFLIDPAQPHFSVQTPVNADGDFSIPVGIAPVPALIGLEILIQAVITPSPAPVGLDVTNGLLWVLGP